MMRHGTASSAKHLRHRPRRDGTQRCRRGQIPVRIVEDQKAARLDLRCDPPREAPSWSGIDESVVERLVGELIRGHDDRISMHLLFVIFTLEIVRDQPVVHVFEPFGTQRSSDPVVIGRVRLEAREMPGPSREKPRGVPAAPFDAHHVTREATIELAHGLGCERWFFGTQRCAERRLEPIAKILRRPVIETAILQREDNARPEVHPRLSVRGNASIRLVG